MITLELEKIGGLKPWVARITGLDSKFGMARDFVTGIADYSRANRPQTRGVYYLYNLVDGIYEVKGGSSWGHAKDRKFIRVEGETQLQIQINEVMSSIATSMNEDEKI